MSARCEQMSERRREWPNTLRIDFIVILPNVRGSGSGGSGPKMDRFQNPALDKWPIKPDRPSEM